MTCPSQSSTITGEFVYGVGTYEGVMKMEMNRGGQTMAMNMKHTAKRLGDCVKLKKELSPATKTDSVPPAR
jgi:hypothetical protein